MGPTPDLSPPEWLSAPEGAVFMQIVRHLEKVPGLLAMADAEAVAVLANAIVEYRDLTALIREEGYRIETRNGGLMFSPLIAARQSAWARMRAGWTQFGLSPADRAALKIMPELNLKTKRMALGGGID